MKRKIYYRKSRTGMSRICIKMNKKNQCRGKNCEQVKDLKRQIRTLEARGRNFVDYLTESNQCPEGHEDIFDPCLADTCDQCRRIWMEGQ
jgi:hypothetical protein